MGKLTPRPEAVVSKAGRKRPFHEICFLAVSLAFLMLWDVDKTCISSLSVIVAAFVLAFMTEEDAKEQTIDLRLLFLLNAAFSALAVSQYHLSNFTRGTLGGILFFALFRLLISFWLTRQAERSPESSKDDTEGKYDIESSSTIMGYVPVFMFVFVLYLGFGTAWAPFVFQQSAVIASLMDELTEIIPEIIWASVTG